MTTQTPGADAVRLALEGYASAWQAGDTGRIVGSYHPDFTLHYFGRHDLAGVHRGKAAALTALQAFSRQTGRSLIAIVDIMVGTTRGALLVRERMGRDAPVVVERLLVYTVEDGLLRECWIYDQDQPLIDRLLAAAAPPR